MPNFKPKPNKEINVDKQSIITVDSKHTEMMEKFEASRQELECLQKQKELLQKTLDENLGHYSVDIILALNDEMENIDKRISVLKTEEKKYLLTNSKYLFDYFLKKQTISSSSNKKKTITPFFNIKTSNLPDIPSVFASASTVVAAAAATSTPATTPALDTIIETLDETEISSTTVPIVASTPSPAQTSFNMFQKPSQLTRDESIHRYMIGLDESYIGPADFTMQQICCTSCGGEIVPITNEGMTVCKKCGVQMPYIIDQNQHSGKEPPKEVSFYAYKRINHFREILAQVQGKETTNVSDVVIENIKNQMRKERITLEQMSNEKTKMILKNLGYNKYYEHIPFIKEKLGIKPPVMPVELEQKLCNLFLEIQRPYAKFCPDERVNFLNYYYVLYKLCELLEADEYLDHFYMLKDPVKRMEQDEIWKKICKELNWEFIPTP